jgi:hypothetical protein
MRVSTFSNSHSVHGYIKLINPVAFPLLSSLKVSG